MCDTCGCQRGEGEDDTRFGNLTQGKDGDWDLVYGEKESDVHGHAVYDGETQELKYLRDNEGTVIVDQSKDPFHPEDAEN